LYYTFPKWSVLVLLKFHNFPMPLDMLLSSLQMLFQIFWGYVVCYTHSFLCGVKGRGMIIIWKIFPIYMLLSSILPFHPYWEPWFIKYWWLDWCFYTFDEKKGKWNNEHFQSLKVSPPFFFICYLLLFLFWYFWRGILCQDHCWMLEMER
jgi:hypothetical protein